MPESEIQEIERLLQELNTSNGVSKETLKSFDDYLIRQENKLKEDILKDPDFGKCALFRTERLCLTSRCMTM